MSKLGVSALAAGLIGGVMLLSGGATPASAAALPGPAVVAPGATAMVEEVGGHNRAYRERRWDRRYHGQRYRSPRAGFRHRYGDHYYSQRWWLGPSIGFGLTLPGVGFGLAAPQAGLPPAHVNWCMNRYQTYDLHTDTYFPRIGVRARCSSPYSHW